MSTIKLTYISHANSLARFVKILNLINGKNTIADIAESLDMSGRSARHYATFGKDLGYVDFERGTNFYLTHEGAKLMGVSEDEMVKNLHKKINSVEEINLAVNNPDVLKEILNSKGITENSAERFILGLMSIGKQSESPESVIDAINGNLNTSGFNVVRSIKGYQKVGNKKATPVHTWNCSCGMVNAPAISECEMCGEDKPEVVQTAAA